jgi:hypothetical protein
MSLNLSRIGIAIGPRTWFGDHYGTNVSKSGTVRNNRFSGAFSYAIAISSATNFTVQDNVLFGNTSFIGARGPNCTENNATPNPAPFIMDRTNVNASSIQSNFQLVDDGDALTCVLPPDGGDFWPFGGNPSTPTTSSTPSSTQSGASRRNPSKGIAAGVPLGVVLGIISIGFMLWLIRKWANRRVHATKLQTP